MRKIKIHPDYLNDPQVLKDMCSSLEEAKAQAAAANDGPWRTAGMTFEVCEAYNAVTGKFIGYAVPFQPAWYDNQFSKPARK